MKYTVETTEREDFTFRAYPEDKTVSITIESDAEYWFDFDQFMDLRRAIGYVFQELTHDA